MSPLYGIPAAARAAIGHGAPDERLPSSLSGT